MIYCLTKFVHPNHFDFFLKEIIDFIIYFTVCFTPLQVKEIPGIMIFRSSATLYFANAEMYIDALYEKVDICKQYSHIYSDTYLFTHIYKTVKKYMINNL